MFYCDNTCLPKRRLLSLRSQDKHNNYRVYSMLKKIIDSLYLYANLFKTVQNRLDAKIKFADMQVKFKVKRLKNPENIYINIIVEKDTNNNDLSKIDVRMIIMVVSSSIYIATSNSLPYLVILNNTTTICSHSIQSFYLSISSHSK